MNIHQFLKFEPILKEKIWGGEKLTTLLHKKSALKNIGESWEVSGVKEAVSVVINRDLAGISLNDLIKHFKDEFVGGKVYKQFGDNFPLLIKFLDAKSALSVQLHPNNDLAKKRHNSFGKNEMWYVVQADAHANVIIGFKEKSNEKEFLDYINKKKLLELLNTEIIKKGDSYFIPAGTIHAIGAGALIAEIQQTSDITYRIYDWERPNLDGTYRELHTEAAKNALDYVAKDSFKAVYSENVNSTSEIISCSYFTTSILPLNGKVEINHQEKDSFVIYMCVSGNVTFQYEDQTENLQLGETLLVPACLKKFNITTEENSKLLEVYIK
ncbi:class I mannose-6-phosphate isomerase [Polaribacter sp.]|nr:class I mannose-6-phosphate isomerase [Polaribacter sp.]